MQEKGFVKIMGLKFDVLEGLNIVTDANRSNIVETAEFAQKHDDNETIWMLYHVRYQSSKIKKDFILRR